MNNFKPTTSRILKLSAIGLGALGLVVAGREAVTFMDDVFRPRYIVNGNSEGSIPPLETKEWQRPTDWSRRK